MDLLVKLAEAILPWMIPLGFVGICIAAAMDPRNRKGSPDAYPEDDYFGL